MTKEALDTVIQELGFIDLGNAVLYFDEEGFIEAAFSSRAAPEPDVEEENASYHQLNLCCV